MKAPWWWTQVVGKLGAIWPGPKGKAMAGAAAKPAHRQVRRGTAAGAPFLALTLEIPAPTYPKVARALAGGIAQVCASRSSTVGSVTVVPREEPALVALAAHLDVVATRLLAVLQAGESHRAPHVVLLLKAGVYLAQVVDPYTPLQGTLEEVGEMLARQKVWLAARLRVRPRGAVVEVELALFAPDRHGLREALAAGRAATRALSR